MIRNFLRSETGAAPTDLLFIACVGVTALAIFAAYAVHSANTERAAVGALENAEYVSMTRN